MKNQTCWDFTDLHSSSVSLNRVSTVVQSLRFTLRDCREDSAPVGRDVQVAETIFPWFRAQTEFAVLVNMSSVAFVVLSSERYIQIAVRSLEWTSQCVIASWEI